MKAMVSPKCCSDTRILIVALKYGYGEPEKGLSYEWSHFYLGLQGFFQDVDFFDFYEPYKKNGIEVMQANLLAYIQKTKPDIILFSLFKQEFTREFIQELKKYAKTFCFFHDDTWRVDFVKYWASCFDAFSTSNIYGYAYYENIGLLNSKFIPFGVNQKLFLNKKCSKNIDVSFVGSWHPYRAWIIKKLARVGIGVQVFGDRWPGGIVDTEYMVSIFNHSKISLNLSNSISWDARYLFSSPRAIVNNMRCKKIGEQIKGRHFEIPACGSMQISFYAEGLAGLFKIDEEIIIFNDIDQLIKLISFYLKHDEERERIANAGYCRVIQSHTYSSRFLELFKELDWCCNN